MSSAHGGQVVARLSDLASGTAKRFDIGGRSVAVIRIDDDVYAIGDTCSHADVSEHLASRTLDPGVDRS